MFVTFSDYDLAGDYTSNRDCPVSRFIKRNFGIDSLDIYTYSYQVSFGEEKYTIKNYQEWNDKKTKGCLTLPRVEIVGLELPQETPKYWCIPATPELSEMFKKILSKKKYKPYNNGTYDNTHFMKVQRTKEIGFYNTHPRDGTNLYPIVSVDFVLEQLEALPEEKVIKIDDLQFGDIAEVTYDGYGKYVGEIVMCINDHDTKTVVTLQPKCTHNPLYIPWVLSKNLQFKVLKSTTLTR